MIETTLPLSPALWATVPAPVRAPLLEEWAALCLENTALRAQKAALQARIRELEARLGQDSSNSSRRPSSDTSPHINKLGLLTPAWRSKPRVSRSCLASLPRPGHSSGQCRTPL